LADSIVINKTDGDNVQKAKLAQLEFNRALHLFPAKKSGWIPTTATCSAITHDGISKVWETIQKYIEKTKSNNYFIEKRKEQNHYWMLEAINEQLKSDFYNQAEIQKLLEINKKAVQNDEISPFEAAQKLLAIYRKQ
jgi:LAO/AO transport system kinase